MQLVFDRDGVEVELDVRPNRPDATVADLARALCPDRHPIEGDVPGGLVVGGRPVGPELGLEEIGLHDGVTVRLPGPTPRPQAHGHPAELRVIGGPEAGRVIVLAAGDHAIGRDGGVDVDLVDPTVSRRHCTLTVSPAGECRVEDLGSLNGTWLDGEMLPGAGAGAGAVVVDPGAVLRFGDVPCVVGPAAGVDRPAAADPLRLVRQTGRIPFNRPPRVLPAPVSVTELTAPTPPARRTAPPFNLISLVAPLVFGVGMAVLVNPAYALLALLSPVMLMGNWVDGKWRDRKEGRASSKEFEKELGQLDQGLRRLRIEEARRRRAAVSDVCEVIRRATTPSVHLWERRRRDHDFLVLEVGTGDLAWRPPVRLDGSAPSPRVSESIERHAVLRDVPVTVDLAEGGVVGIVGPRDAALALARSLLCQTAVHHGPADVATAVLVSPTAGQDWDWGKVAPACPGPERGRERPDARGRPRRLRGPPAVASWADRTSVEHAVLGRRHRGRRQEGRCRTGAPPRARRRQPHRGPQLHRPCRAAGQGRSFGRHRDRLGGGPAPPPCARPSWSSRPSPAPRQ